MYAHGVAPKSAETWPAVRNCARSTTPVYRRCRGDDRRPLGGQGDVHTGIGIKQTVGNGMSKHLLE